MKIGVIYGSTRDLGNTELLAEHVIKGLNVRKIFLKDYEIEDIEDRRHEPGGFLDVEDDYNQLVEIMLDCDVLIFATPIYWYGMSGIMKTFIDRWSQVMRDEKYPHFKDEMSRKSAYILAVGGDDPQTKGVPLVEQFKYICRFIGLEFQDYILGEGVKPNDILEDKNSIDKALKINEILVTIEKRIQN
ncbi:NAD(P)H-dependent oxidoreductase [Bacillus sp. LL01]|uniref:flavodoxin family protein n=1 Tax=Bacillus sp. LL01 TaxID=1665556 RepID=UPI00064D338C|nr:flavodoxin family protein [Bacillus sp. LL01]KMJ57161.1 NAD(P)H-dependent oxidoreductase [Bacillus sp. LL01]